MVLLSAVVCDKNGKTLVSRQFVEMVRSRIEGLLAAFPRLLSTDRQCTFVETETVRYVYQPLDELYILLLTTKESNILEDLTTLKLFSQVVPDYCRVLTECEVCEHAFDLITAFDEVVALGYREDVDLRKIKAYTDMDSLEEREFIRQRKEREAEAMRKMKEKAKQFSREKSSSYSNMRSGNMWSASSQNSYGGGYGNGSGVMSSLDSLPSHSSSRTASSRPAQPAGGGGGGGGRALKLGTKKGVDTFVSQLRAEGAQVGTVGALRQPTVPVQTTSAARSAVHINMEEKLVVLAGRDTGLENVEVA